jgi:K+-sensing histidine kinase KdpD
VTELVENAAAHAGPGAHIVIECDPIEGAVALRVVDDGPGLPESEQAVLADGVETPLVHGSGLGLWMVYWIVTNHDGTIDAAVTEEGTTITVTLPRVPTDEGILDDERALRRGFDRRTLASLSPTICTRSVRVSILSVLAIRTAPIAYAAS